MRSNYFDPERRFVDRHNANPMHDPDRFDGPSLADGGEEKAKLVLRHPLKCFVFDSGDLQGLFVPTHHTHKINDRAHPAGQRTASNQARFVDRLVRDGELRVQLA
jgi:hypothetical protein